MTITRQIQQHGMSIWSKPSIIFVIVLFVGAGVQYNEYLNRQDNFGGTTRQRRSLSEFYDTDLDDDLEMATSTVYESSTEDPTNKLSFSPTAKPAKVSELNIAEISSNGARNVIPATTAAQKCVSPALIDWNEPVEPKYKLDSTKFLIPALIWGPMNQVEGLRESIAIAISLNRTLVLPPMYRHFTDPDGPNGIVESDIRVDIPSIRNLLSVTSYQSLTNQTPDGVLYARTIGFGSSESNQKFTTSNSRLGRLKKFEKATGYNVLKPNQPRNPMKTDDFFSLNLTPKNANFDNDVRMDQSTNWNQIFGSNNTYEVLLFPYLTAKIETQQQIGKDIMTHTLRPKFIHSMVDEFFTSNGLPRTIVTIHYRFDEEDWERSCHKHRVAAEGHESRGNNRAKICSLLANSSSDGLATSLASFLVELFSLNQIGNEVAFYIATPPQQQETIKETTKRTIELVKEQIGHNIPVSGKSTADSIGYITEKYNECNFVERNMHELSSLFEQEVCSRGQVFVFAPSSSWSGAVRRERHSMELSHKMIDHSLLDILENYPKDETKLLDAALKQRQLK